MAVSTNIDDYLRQVKEATYGKDVREAIYQSLKACYGYTSGQTADEAAERANRAAEKVEAVIDESEETLDELQRAVRNVDNIVVVSDEQPSAITDNKIWIQPQNNEYKIATYAAYEALWNQMKGMSETYEQGHGGVVNFEEDAEYEDLEDELKRRFVITYSDGTTGEVFIHDGERGEVGPIAEIQGVTVFYKKQSASEYDGTPPVDTWESRMPSDLNSGDYLWTMSKVTFKTKNENEEPKPQAYLYGLSRMGIDGSGAVNSVAIGANGATLAGDVKLPIDSVPTENSGNLLTSGAIFTALQSAGSLDSPAFTGTPTAPTPDVTDSSTRLATTEFVQNVVDESSASLTLFPVSLQTNELSISYSDAIFTENTVVVGVTGLDYSKLTADITWTTTSGNLALSTTSAPKETVNFNLVLAATA